MRRPTSFEAIKVSFTKCGAILSSFDTAGESLVAGCNLQLVVPPADEAGPLQVGAEVTRSLWGSLAGFGW